MARWRVKAQALRRAERDRPWIRSRQPHRGPASHTFGYDNSPSDHIDGVPQYRQGSLPAPRPTTGSPSVQRRSPSCALFGRCGACVAFAPLSKDLGAALEQSLLPLAELTWVDAIRLADVRYGTLAFEVLPKDRYFLFWPEVFTPWCC